jgi:predicted aspartyl protease
MIPTTGDETSEKLDLTVKMGKENFKFLVDTGASASLIQPEVGSGLTPRSQHVVRRVTGSQLEIQGLRCLRFQLGTRTYDHTFLVARIATKCHGIMGLDILKALQALVDTRNNRIWTGKENCSLTSDKSDGQDDGF